VISQKWLISLSLVFLMAVTFTLSACTPSISDDNGIVDDDEVTTEYRVGGLSMMDSLNMQPEGLMYTNVGCLYMIFNYENLAAYPKIDGDPPQSNYDFIPRLATDYTVTYDGTDQIWTITLREGVKWHDGEDFTADDVVFSVMYVQNKFDVTKPIDWNAVEEDTEWEEVWSEHVLVEADGPYTVKMTYIDGWHQPEDYVPNWWMYDPIVPEHVFGPEGEGVYEDWNEDPHLWDGKSIGTGPYKLTEFEPDQYVLFERFDDYWGPKPAAEKHLFRFYGDPGSLNTALEAGAIDSLSDESIPFLKIASYEADPNIEVSFDKGLSVYYLGFNLHPDEGYKPLQDRVLRQAIAYAIDEQNIVALIYGGYGEVPSGFIFSESPNYNPDLPDYSLDLEKSSKLLEDAGYTKVNDYWHNPDGEKIAFTLTTISGVYADMALMITANLQDFGLDVTHEIIDSTTFIQYLYQPDTGGMQAFIYAEDPGMDPMSDWIWMQMADPYFWGYGWNYTWYNNPVFNELFMENYLAENLDDKKNTLFEMQAIMAEDLPLIFLARPDFISAHRTDRWDNWYNTIGGPYSWLNEYSVREVTIR
jgi:peptide/nickel transport system substrate-binding protein